MPRQLVRDAVQLPCFSVDAAQGRVHFGDRHAAAAELYFELRAGPTKAPEEDFRLELVAEKEGWANVPPGTRTSLYENEEYQKVPFAKMTLDSINSADPNNPTVDPVPYVGVQFVAIPEFQGIGTAVGQQFSAALAGNVSAEQALNNAQQLAKREMTKAGYIK